MKAMGVKKAVVINPEVGNVSVDLRAKGFKEGMGSGVEVLGTTMDFTACRDAVSAYLPKTPDLDAIMGLGSTSGAEPALEALKDAGKMNKVKLATFDLSPIVLQALANKQIEFAIDQQEFFQGYLSVIFMARYLRYGLLAASNPVLTGPAFVTSENAQQVIELSKKGIR
jgi:simple sugar transport system substrate-binding protein